MLSAGGGQRPPDGGRADGNAVYGGVRGQDPACKGWCKVGDDGLWAEDRWHPLYYAIRVEQVALPLYPQWGTEPNGFYIPPRQAPRGYIRQMFGPGVDNAIEKYLVPSRELLAVLQLWRASQQIIFRYDVIPGPKVFETQIHGRKFEMYNDTVLGFNKSGKEAVRHAGGRADLHPSGRAGELAVRGESPERSGKAGSESPRSLPFFSIRGEYGLNPL